MYARVRRSVIVEGKSEGETARLFGLAHETGRKMVRYSAPPGYRRQQAAWRPQLHAWTGVIDQILEDDNTRGKNQRQTAKRIFERLWDEHGYKGGYTIVKDYARLRKVSQREMFVPLTGALLDRLTHHVHILEMNGESYRLKDSKRRRSAKVRS